MIITFNITIVNLLLIEALVLISSAFHHSNIKLPKNFDMVSYWASWTISLLVTASNGFLQLFSLDKNYFTYSIVTEQLKTEGWQFFQLSGKYEQFDEHIECYKLFCKSIAAAIAKSVLPVPAGPSNVTTLILSFIKALIAKNCRLFLGFIPTAIFFSIFCILPL